MNKTKLPQILLDKFSEKFYNYFPIENAFDLIADNVDMFLEEIYEFHRNHKGIKSDDDYQFIRIAYSIENNEYPFDLNKILFEDQHRTQNNTKESKRFIPLLFTIIGNGDLNDFIIKLFKFLHDTGIILYGRGHTYCLILHFCKYGDRSYNDALYKFMYDYHINTNFAIQIQIY